MDGLVARCTHSLFPADSVKRWSHLLTAIVSLGLTLAAHPGTHCETCQPHWPAVFGGEGISIGKLTEDRII